MDSPQGGHVILSGLTSLFSPCFSPRVAFKLPGQFSKAKDWTGSGMTGTYQNDPNPTQLQAKRCSSQLNYLPVEQLMRSWSPADGSRYPPLLELLCKFKMPALPCMSCCKQALIAELRFQEVFSPINPVLRGIISLFCTVLQRNNISLMHYTHQSISLLN